MCDGLITSNWWLMGDEFHSANVCKSIELGQYSKVVYVEKKNNGLSHISVTFKVPPSVQFKTPFVFVVVVQMTYNLL